VFGSPKAEPAQNLRRRRNAGQSHRSRWLAKDEHIVFRNQYGLAHELQLHLLLDEIIEIADDASKDVKLAKCDGTAGRHH
jgi:hypothetical protein